MKKRILKYLLNSCTRACNYYFSRFTTELAKVAKRVTAVDFIQSYVEKNQETNGHNSHVNFMTADVTELELPNNRLALNFTVSVTDNGTNYSPGGSLSSLRATLNVFNHFVFSLSPAMMLYSAIGFSCT